MSSMSQLADLAASLIQFQSYKRKPDEAWEVNKDLQAEIRDLHKKLGDVAPQSSIPSIPPQPPITSDEQFACDFEHAQIASLSGIPHHDQPGIGTSVAMQYIPPPNTFTSRGRAQHQFSPLYEDQQQPVCLWQQDDWQVGQAIQWERDMMGPITIYNTTEEIHKLYTTVYNEPENKAPCIHKAQDLVGMNEVMDLTLKEWRPPILAAQKAHQKREVLRDKERASQAQTREGGPSRFETVGGQLTLQGWIADTPPIPSAVAAEELTPIMPLAHHVAAQLSGGPTPNPYQRPPESSQLQGGAVPELPYGAPSTFAPVNDWSSKLSRMSPRALGFSSPDNDEAEDVQGFLLYKCLVPVSQRDHDQNIWLCKLIKLLTVKGWYRALPEWAEVAPANGTPVPWEGGFTHLATVANVTTYLAANGITYHDANDALKWAQRAGNEYVAQVISNGGDKDPNTKVIIDQMRATLNEPLPVGGHHSLEWIDLQAHVLRVTPKSIAPYEACPIKERDLLALKEFTKLAALYDLSHHARGEGSNTGGVIPIPAGTLKEGEMEEDLRPM
ncbi:hypothetical protein EDC04DRAFT_2600084 [Pisolithus marmoratus]|nr:hypothetical protein EDC04DRAFT_2600084 [Pisolithus marmoratus]